MVLLEEKTRTAREFLDLDIFEDSYFYELINGEIVKRASPSTNHQNASSNLLRILFRHVPDKVGGKIFHAPFDVYLNEENLLQPDIMFVSEANAAIIKKGCIEGAPELIVEILSPATFKTDRGDKFKLYRRFGVAEYWIVDPRTRIVEIYSLQNGDYDMTSFALETGIVHSKLLEGLAVDIEQVFG